MTARQNQTKGKAMSKAERNVVRAVFNRHPYGQNPAHMTRGDMVNALMDAQEKARAAWEEARYWRDLLKGKSQTESTRGTPCTG